MSMDDAASLDEVQLRKVFLALQENAVEYAVFGAVALGFHGLARTTGDLDLFIQPTTENVDRLKAALRSVFDDPCIDEIRSEDLCGDYPAVRYLPPEGFGFDLVTRRGEVVRYSDLEIESKTFDGVSVRVVTPRSLWLLKKDTIRNSSEFHRRVLLKRRHYSFGESLLVACAFSRFAQR